tara:strand:- start:2085 stop:3032 length:948 start_codon:yes stop_codon:yes gene_type:complete
MVLKRNDYLIGIDCGASKVLLQSAKINSSRTIISKGQYFKEYVYSSHPDWDPSYRPIPLDVQIKENNNKSILIRKAERKQGDIIVKLLQDIIENISGSQIGICFPGIKDDYGVTILANGPRIPELLTRLNKVDTLYNDSDCCITGEMVSDIGRMNDIHNGIYIGGGTGIADGILLDGKMINLNNDKNPKKSWELVLPQGVNVESCLSPGGILKNHNLKYKTKITSLKELSDSQYYEETLSTAITAFDYLLQDRLKFFQRHKTEIEKIVIGQRLGQFLNEQPKSIKHLFQKDNIAPVEFSFQREIAALGAAWKVSC